MTLDEQITLKEYFEVRVTALEKATTLAAEQMDKRLEGMNEFRGQLKDQGATFLTRNEYAIAHEKLCDDIKLLREFRAQLEGKASQQAVILAMIISVIGIILSIVSLVKEFVK